MKKLINWLKSSKSDFVLFILLLVLLNFAGHNTFIRFDLTSPKSYSLSKASKSVVKNLEQPLSVRVFFDDNLPNQYNTVHQYVKDILTEYKGAANKNFSVSHMNMKDEKNITLARDLGLQQIQIQEVKNNEVGFKQGYMGLVVAYGDAIEVLNPITTTDGFEYSLTTSMTKMITKSDVLNGLKAGDKINLTLYMSDVIKTFGIMGADDTQEIVENAYDKVNKQNLERIDFNVISPDSVESEYLAEKYGIQTINYKDRNGIEQRACIGLVLSHDDKSYALPLQIAQSLFGYTISGLDDLENAINQGMQSLLSNVKKIGYVTGHMELAHSENAEASNLNTLISGMYELVDLDLNSADIPAGMNSIIINGPKYDFTEEELYKLDQFVLRGGNLLCFIDGVIDNGANQQYGMPNFVPANVNIDRLLNNYGVNVCKNMVMDKNCYQNMNAQYGELNLYWAPVLHKANFPKKNIITNNLGYVVSLQNSQIDASKAQENKDLKVTVLSKSSPEAWTMETGIILNPLYMEAPYDPSVYGTFDFSVLVEGKFSSIFDEAPAKNHTDEEKAVENNTNSELTTSSHISSSVMPGKIFVSGSSSMTTNQVIAGDGTAPAGMFLMNIIDYMNGNEDLCSMRSKILAVNNLTIKHAGAAMFWKYAEQYGLVVILALVGFIVWRMRTNRRKQINNKYNPNDDRTIEK